MVSAGTLAASAADLAKDSAAQRFELPQHTADCAARLSKRAFCIFQQSAKVGEPAGKAGCFAFYAADRPGKRTDHAGNAAETAAKNGHRFSGGQQGRTDSRSCDGDLIKRHAGVLQRLHLVKDHLQLVGDCLKHACNRCACFGHVAQGGDCRLYSVTGAAGFFAGSICRKHSVQCRCGFLRRANNFGERRLHLIKYLDVDALDLAF